MIQRIVSDLRGSSGPVVVIMDSDFRRLPYEKKQSEIARMSEALAGQFGEDIAFVWNDGYGDSAYWSTGWDSFIKALGVNGFHARATDVFNDPGPKSP